MILKIYIYMYTYNKVCKYNPISSNILFSFEDKIQFTISTIT